MTGVQILLLVVVLLVIIARGDRGVATASATSNWGIGG